MTTTNKKHLDAIADRALQALKEHGLTQRPSWTFKWDHAVRRFGSCNFVKRCITVSKPLAALNSFAEAEDVILHEVAHALVGRGYGHGPRWVAQARAIGCNGQRCYDSSVARPTAKFIATCPACGKRFERNRRRRTACGPCCRQHNGGRYDSRFDWVWTRR